MNVVPTSLESFRRELRSLASDIYCGDFSKHDDYANKYAETCQRFYTALESRIAEVPGELVLVVRRDESHPAGAYCPVSSPGFVSELLLGVLVPDRAPKSGWKINTYRFPTTRYVRSRGMSADALTMHWDSMNTALLPAFRFSVGTEQYALDLFVGNQEVRAWLASIAGYAPFLSGRMLARLGYAFDLSLSQGKGKTLSLFV